MAHLTGVVGRDGQGAGEQVVIVALLAGAPSTAEHPKLADLVAGRALLEVQALPASWMAGLALFARPVVVVTAEACA